MVKLFDNINELNIIVEKKEKLVKFSNFILERRYL